MKTMLRKALPIAALALLTLTGAHAHDWFIQATDYALPQAGRTALFMGWGHALPLDDPLAGEKVASLHMTGPDGSAQEIDVAPGRGYHYTPVSLDSEGLWTFHGESNPGYYAIYQDADGNTHHTTKPLDELEDVARVFFSVRAFQFPKAYVVVGEAESAETPEPVGAKLEIIPEAVPGTIHAGERLSLRVLFDGEPVGGDTKFDATYLGFSTAAEDYLYAQRPLVDGRGWVDLSHDGPWYIRVQHALPAPEGMQDKFKNLYYNATLVLNVQPREAGHSHHDHGDH